MRRQGGSLSVFSLIWLKILNMNVKQLVHVAYREMFQHQEQHAWIRHNKDLLCCHGFGNIWNDQSVMNEKVFLATFEQWRKNEFIQKCFSDIWDSDRCRLYEEIKTVFECESYMNCNIRRDARVCFTKLRLSSHKFLVERARWLKGTDQAGTFMSLKCVVYYANYRSWHQSSKIQVVS